MLNTTKGDLMKYNILMNRFGVLALMLSIAPVLSLAQSSDGEEMMDESDSSAVEEVETTVFDLEQYINMPAGARLRRESEEDLNNPTAIFADPETRREFFGEAPPYVYIPQGVDPMIIPWIRNDIVASELLRDVQNAFNKAKGLDDIAAARSAAQKLEALITQYPETSSVEDAQKLNTEMRTWITTMTAEKPVGPEGPVENVPRPVNIDLPSWVVSNTRGVIVDNMNPNQSVVLVGDLILKPGDSLTGQFAAVSVKEVSNQTVIYEYLDIDHVVLVESN